MQVFKTAIKTVLRHPMYLIVYAGFLSMMGVFIASGLTFGGTNDSEFSPYETKFAVIDRDGSALSDGLAAYLREQGIEVPIEDSQMALQDAVAKGQSSYILIVPEGFGDAFVEAARTGDELPTLETVYSFYSTEGSLMDQMVNSYLGIAGAYAGLEGSIVAVSSIDDIDLLLAIAAGNGPSFVRRNALHRIDELCDRTPLDVRDAQRLVACLSEKSLIAFAVALMDMSDYDWPSHCDVTSVGALCEALYSCTSIHETVLLEDACAHLAHRRPDLLSSIGACAPDHYPMVA